MTAPGAEAACGPCTGPPHPPTELSTAAPPAPGTHLHAALAAGTGRRGGGALHATLGQEPHRLEQEQTVPSVVTARPCPGSYESSGGLSNCLSAQMGAKGWCCGAFPDQTRDRQQSLPTSPPPATRPQGRGSTGYLATPPSPSTPRGVLHCTCVVWSPPHEFTLLVARETLATRMN